MRANDFDIIMRQYEEALDQKILPNVWPLVRLDGCNFGTLVASHHLERPFDKRLYSAMIATGKYLMMSDFKGIYAYIESDEISIVFPQNSTYFLRQIRKWLSILAGMASAVFTKEFHDIGIFDARICPIPNIEILCDYFRWRQETCQRTSLQQICYWMLRQDNQSPQHANSLLAKLDYDGKLELLRTYGQTYKLYPAEYRVGTGMKYSIVEKVGINPKHNQPCVAKRRVLETITTLPTGETYNTWLKDILK